MSVKVNIKLEMDDLNKKIDEAINKTRSNKIEALRAVGDEIMRLSESEVPHDVGDLSASGVVRDDNEDVYVGYNKMYASRLHENPQFNFQKGRKAKYLEDPIKNNLSSFKKFFEKELWK